MALTSNQDAENVNKLVDFLYEQTNPAGRIPTEEEFTAALAELADAAYKKLAAGTTGNEVRELSEDRMPTTFPKQDGTLRPIPSVPLDRRKVADRDVYDAIVADPDPHENNARWFELLGAVTRAQPAADGTPARFTHQGHELVATVQANGVTRVTFA